MIATWRSGRCPWRVLRLPRSLARAMRGDDVPVVEHLDAVRGEAHVDALADQRVGHRVIRAADLDVIIGMDLGLPPLAELVRAQRQRLAAPRVRALRSASAGSPRSS